MNRRDFLHRSALIAAGAVAADQLDLLDRLGWVRRLFPGFGPGTRTLGRALTTAEWDILLRPTFTADYARAIRLAVAEMEAFDTRCFRKGMRLIEVVHG